MLKYTVVEETTMSDIVKLVFPPYAGRVRLPWERLHSPVEESDESMSEESVAEEWLGESESEESESEESESEESDESESSDCESSESESGSSECECECESDESECEDCKSDESKACRETADLFASRAMFGVRVPINITLIQDEPFRVRIIEPKKHLVTTSVVVNIEKNTAKCNRCSLMHFRTVQDIAGYHIAFDCTTCLNFKLQFVTTVIQATVLGEETITGCTGAHIYRRLTRPKSTRNIHSPSTPLSSETEGSSATDNWYNNNQCTLPVPPPVSPPSAFPQALFAGCTFENDVPPVKMYVPKSFGRFYVRKPELKIKIPAVIPDLEMGLDRSRPYHIPMRLYRKPPPPIPRRFTAKFRTLENKYKRIFSPIAPPVDSDLFISRSIPFDPFMTQFFKNLDAAKAESEVMLPLSPSIPVAPPLSPSIPVAPPLPVTPIPIAPPLPPSIPIAPPLPVTPIPVAPPVATSEQSYEKLESGESAPLLEKNNEITFDDFLML